MIHVKRVQLAKINYFNEIKSEKFISELDGNYSSYNNLSTKLDRKALKNNYTYSKSNHLTFDAIKTYTKKWYKIITAGIKKLVIKKTPEQNLLIAKIKLTDLLKEQEKAHKDMYFYCENAQELDNYITTSKKVVEIKELIARLQKQIGKN